MDALSGLRMVFGNEQKHPDVLTRFLQLGNEIGAEQGSGRDPDVMQLIAALLQQPQMARR